MESAHNGDMTYHLATPNGIGVTVDGIGFDTESDAIDHGHHVNGAPTVTRTGRRSWWVIAMTTTPNR